MVQPGSALLPRRAPIGNRLMTSHTTATPAHPLFPTKVRKKKTPACSMHGAGVLDGCMCVTAKATDFPALGWVEFVQAQYRFDVRGACL